MYRVIIRNVIASDTFGLVEIAATKKVLHAVSLVETTEDVVREVASVKKHGEQVLQVLDSELKDVTEQFTEKCYCKPLHIGNVGGIYGFTVAIYADGTAFVDGKMVEVENVTIDGYEVDGDFVDVLYWSYTNQAHKVKGNFKPVNKVQYDSQSVYDYEITYTICKETNLLLDCKTVCVNEDEE